MGTDQGKISSINSLGIVSKILNKKISEVGTTTYRPPYAPLSFAAIAGRSTYEYYDPERKTPIHNWHIKNNAVFEDVGNGNDLGILKNMKQKLCIKQFKESQNKQDAQQEF